jgi:hypothetical protein
VWLFCKDRVIVIWEIPAHSVWLQVRHGGLEKSYKTKWSKLWFISSFYQLFYSITQQSLSTNLKPRRKDEIFTVEFQGVISSFDLDHQRAISLVQPEGLSSRLTFLPISKDNFDFSLVEFRDGLSIRYRKTLLRVPNQCDGCGSTFDLSHALSCRKGGLVTRRHNQVRDVVAGVLSIIWNNIKFKGSFSRFANTYCRLSHPGLMVTSGWGIFRYSRVWHWRPILQGSFTLSSVKYSWDREKEIRSRSKEFSLLP